MDARGARAVGDDEFGDRPDRGEVGYARDVARELMRSREIQTRYWLLEVYRDGEGPLFDILFASVDPTLDHLRREFRSLVEKVSQNKRALRDIANAVNLTMRESKSLLARLPWQTLPDSRKRRDYNSWLRSATKRTLLAAEIKFHRSTTAR
jgi:hypothetical protein